MPSKKPGKTPYHAQSDFAFWRNAVAETEIQSIRGLWSPKYHISKETKIATYGSCFAQHIARALRSRGYSWVDSETPPIGISKKTARDFNFRVYSSRTGNIYTSTQLLQWATWATGGSQIPEEYWEENGRIFDPFRPRVEPNGFLDVEELHRSQAHTLSCFRHSIEHADLLIFTMGLTETWVNSDGQYEYANCPGTIAGDFDSEKHHLVNLNYRQVKRSLIDALSIFRGINPSLKVLLTVSPVPLTATATNNHVLTATYHSKSLLRTVAGELAERRGFIDYFPSYEIVTNPFYDFPFFENNKRTVSCAGVSEVMKLFFRAVDDEEHSSQKKQEVGLGLETPQEQKGALFDTHVEEVVCEESLLESFGLRET